MSEERSGALDAFDLARTFVHLGRDSTATPLPDFEWSADYVEAYRRRFATDGKEGRLVCVIAQDATWDGWERHPAGEEVVVLLSGRVDIVQELDGADHIVELRPGEAMVNPANVWHTARVHEQGLALFITPGDGTEHRPLA
jgi:mannose-6-phosphate isomerase-like protein (cupin superfamily)